MQISIQNRQRKFKIDNDQVIEWARQILLMQKMSKGELGLVFVNNRRIQIFNREYRMIDRPTDVLAFPMREGFGGDLHPAFLGDVMISLEMVERDARRYPCEVEAQLLHLIIHGILHLLGYDHTRSALEAKRMARREKWILNRIR
ncbi:rRNA maturation RNase YbeY [Nitrospira defluvii]|nr:rRNA maturation RNase YbeY [Nitrospira defluvii]